jgi:ATP-dependent 26S proteasome regulatory subunit
MEESLEEKLRSRHVVTQIVTLEEERTLQRIQAVGEKLGYAGIAFNCLQGFSPLSSGDFRLPGDGQGSNLIQAFNAIAAYTQVKALFIIQDIQETIRRIENSPDMVLLIRRIKELHKQLKAGQNAVVFLASSASVPPELEDYVTLVEAALPDQPERLAIVTAWIQTNCPTVPCDVSEEMLHRIATAAAGMTSRQIQSALAVSVVRAKALVGDVIKDMVAEKVAAVRKTDLLEVVTPADLTAVGGQEGIKKFLRKRKLAFSPAAVRYGLPKPRGILLVGPPGVGKSLLAKATASTMDMSLVRFDVGRIYGSLVGQSEERLRRALDMVEKLAPTVLWLDELDKAFGGAAGTAGDGGVAQRILGAMLTWMNDHQAPVFLMATANNIQQLPREFVRKGRFDEIFFVDLPTSAERKAILEVLLRKYGQAPRGLATDGLVGKIDRFTGAEIEQLIVEALFDAFDANQRPMTVGDLEAAATRIVPLADQARTEIEELRRWGRANARAAS